MRRLLEPGARLLDRTLAAASLRLRRERPALLAFVFHGLFESQRELTAGLVDPFQPFLLSDLQRFIEYFLEHGYRFVTPEQILGELEPTGYYGLITFDDGYANNLRAVPVLRQFSTPATFFASANHIADGKAFWWDVVYRERTRSGLASAAVREEQAALKLKSNREIEAYLHAEFGERALRPAGDTDRPMTASELSQLAAEPLVTVGNHTADHAILTVYDDCEVRDQIHTCQEYLREFTGTAPEVIAYPNGDYDDRIVRIAQAEGLRLGVVVESRKNRLPLTERARMTVARHFVRAGPALLADCRRARSDLRLRKLLRRPAHEAD